MQLINVIFWCIFISTIATTGWGRNLWCSLSWSRKWLSFLWLILRSDHTSHNLTSTSLSIHIYFWCWCRITTFMDNNRHNTLLYGALIFACSFFIPEFNQLEIFCHLKVCWSGLDQKSIFKNFSLLSLIKTCEFNVYGSLLSWSNDSLNWLHHKKFWSGSFNLVCNISIIIKASYLELSLEWWRFIWLDKIDWLALPFRIYDFD